MSNVFEATYRKATADDFEFMYSLWRCNQRFGMSIPRKGRITEWLDRG